MTRPDASIPAKKVSRSIESKLQSVRYISLKVMKQRNFDLCYSCEEVHQQYLLIVCNLSASFFSRLWPSSHKNKIPEMPSTFPFMRSLNMATKPRKIPPKRPPSADFSVNASDIANISSACLVVKVFFLDAAKLKDVVLIPFPFFR